MRDDVIGLLDHLGLRQVILAGHSMGAVVAYLVTIARPDLVTRLIIEYAPPGKPHPQDRLAEAAARIPACDLITIPAAHNVHATRPAEFKAAVLAWLPA
jgi:pimeloyl-ACP methyl ester carboxylesterase